MAHLKKALLMVLILYVEKITGNQPIIFPKDACQLTKDKQKESVEINDFLYSEMTRH